MTLPILAEKMCVQQIKTSRQTESADFNVTSRKHDQQNATLFFWPKISQFKKKKKKSNS